MTVPVLERIPQQVPHSEKRVSKLGGLGFGAYWLATADARMERAATESLIEFSQLQSTRLTLGDKQVMEISRAGIWGKQWHEVDASRWTIARSGSSTYPFNATVTISYIRHATVYHESKKEAEADEQYYCTRDDKVYKTKEGYSSFPYKRQRVFELIYDPQEHSWKVQSEKTIAAPNS